MTAPASRNHKVRFPELSVAGTSVEMGRAIGEARREHIRELCDLVVERFNRGNGYARLTSEQAEVRALAALSFAEAYAPHLVEELRGTAQGAGVSVGKLMVLNARNMLGQADDVSGRSIADQQTVRTVSTSASEGCTSLMVSGQASVTRGAIAGQNWDNDPAMDRFSTVLTRHPKGRPAVMTWTQPGLIAYIGMNSAGIGVLMNALNGPSRARGVPWYFIVRSIYEQTSLSQAVETVSAAPRTISANAAMVTSEGAADIEVTPDEVRVLRAAEVGLLSHTNHCLHDDLIGNNQQYAARIFGQSFDRKARADALLQRQGTGVTTDNLKLILADHDGYPTAICRHTNADTVTGWQRTVVSIILEPSAGTMHVSRGNPCEMPYETYRMN